MSIFEIDPDIRKARTLDSSFYTDERYFDISRKKIFARSWQFLGMVSDVNALEPHVLLPGLLDEPLLVVRNEGSVSCLSNVCTHRGKVLVEEACTANLIRCKYHGRRFSLDGKFMSMPEFEEVLDFPSESDNLANVPFAVWHNFMFTSVDPVAPFTDVIGDAATGFDQKNPGELVLTDKREYPSTLIGRCIVRITSRAFTSRTSIIRSARSSITAATRPRFLLIRVSKQHLTVTGI